MIQQFTCFHNQKAIKAGLKDNHLEFYSANLKMLTFLLNHSTQISWIQDSGLFTSFQIQGLQFESDHTTIIELRNVLRSRVIFKSINKSFTIVKAIGRGAFSVINCPYNTRALEQIYKTPLAVKIIDKAVSPMNVILNEIQILRQIQGKHIVRLFEVYESKQSFYLVQEKLKPLDLIGIKENKLKNITKQVIKTVQYLHKQGIMHRDVKESNIMQSDSGDIILVDFGLASQDLNSKECQGTQGYIAPEILNNQQYDHRCDWYSVGVTLYRLFQYTYLDQNQINCNIDLQQMNFFPAHGQTLLKGLLEQDPKFRFTAKQALSSKFLKITQPCDEEEQLKKNIRIM